MQLTDKLTDNFTLGEMLFSATAEGYKKVAEKEGTGANIKADMLAKYKAQYQPSDIIVDALTQLCKNTLQPIANKCDQLYGSDSYIKVRSGYRSPAVNSAVGSKPTSQHIKGEAADIDLFVDGVERNDLLVAAIKLMHDKGTLKFDQLILEHGTPENPQWVHISYDLQGNQRGIVMKKTKGVPGYPKYNLFN